MLSFKNGNGDREPETILLFVPQTSNQKPEYLPQYWPLDYRIVLLTFQKQIKMEFFKIIFNQLNNVTDILNLYE